MTKEFLQWYAEHAHRLRDVSEKALELAFAAGRQAEKEAYAARANAERIMDID